VPTRNELWTKIQQLLQENLSKPSYETWIRPAEFFDFKDGCLTLVAPNSFSSDWLRKNYTDTIEEVASEIFGHEVKVYIKVKDESPLNKSNKKKTFSDILGFHINLPRHSTTITPVCRRHAFIIV